MINTDVQKFFKKNNIDIVKVSSNVDCQIYSGTQINEISDRYGIRKESKYAEVCIADIL